MAFTHKDQTYKVVAVTPAGRKQYLSILKKTIYRKMDVEGLEGEILQKFKPYIKMVKHFRGEWHGDTDIPLIEDALKDTHTIFFDKTYTTHGDVIADLKPELYDEYSKFDNSNIQE